jgi:hypothetical protein
MQNFNFQQFQPFLFSQMNDNAKKKWKTKQTVQLKKSFSNACDLN